MINYILYRIGEFIALKCPLKIAYRVAILISDIRYLFAHKDRREVTLNLKAISPEKTEEEIAKIRLAVFRNFAKYLVDFFRFSEVSMDYIRRNIKVENKDYLDNTLKEKKGVITLTAHLGNWELGGVMIALLGYPFWVVALPHKNKKVDDFFNWQRSSKGVHVIPLGRAVLQCLQTLKKGEILALVGDRNFGPGGIKVDLFGKPTVFPEGPAAIAIKTGSPIVPGFLFRNEDDTFTLRFEKPIYPNNQDKKTLIALYKTIIEDYIRKFPDQWYMFRKFWVESI